MPATWVLTSILRREKTVKVPARNCMGDITAGSQSPATLPLVELNEARLSLVESFIMLLALAILCHKEIVMIKSLVGGFGYPSWFFMA